MVLALKTKTGLNHALKNPANDLPVRFIAEVL
jgi:hypothetical protein